MPLVAFLLARYWKPLALALAVTAALAYRAMLVHQLSDARQKATQLTAEVATLRVTNQALGAMIARQNAAVAELKASADAAANTMEANEATAMRAGVAAENQAQQRARALIAAPIDARSGCEGAIRWGNAQAAELSAW